MYCKPGPCGCLGAACSWRRVHSGPAAKGVSLLHLQLLLPADRRNGVVRSRRLSIHLAAPGALLTRPDAWNSSPWKSCRLAGSSSKTLKNCHSSEIRLPNIVLRAFFFHSSLSCLSTMGKKIPPSYGNQPSVMSSLRSVATPPAGCTRHLVFPSQTHLRSNKTTVLSRRPVEMWRVLSITNNVKLLHSA